MRYYRACQAVMDKASMLYCRFKNSFLLGEGEEVLSQAYLHSLLQEREREEQQRWKLEEERRKRGADGESRGEEEVQSIQTQGCKICLSVSIAFLCILCCLYLWHRHGCINLSCMCLCLQVQWMLPDHMECTN